MLKKTLCMAAALIAMTACSSKASEKNAVEEPAQEGSTVYFTSDISPEGLIKVYEALGVEPHGNVAVKISTGESMKSHNLSPELIKPLVDKVNGTLVECNTAYGGSRATTEDHLKTIHEHGYDTIAKVDIMDANGEMKIAVKDTTHMKYNIVGKDLAKYDHLINLAHFKGHAMGGFGGVLKNQSIGIASANGKMYIHTCGAVAEAGPQHFADNKAGQDAFIESMAVAADAVQNYMEAKGDKIVYIDVMNNLSVDCDCDGNPHAPEMKDIGILASTDPVALDQACVDLVFNHQNKEGDNSAALIERINSRHGLGILKKAEELGMGSRKYHIVDIDKK